LRENYPDLIVCNVSGYGSSGPYWDKKAYDLLVQCEAGLVSITGTPETPSKVGISVADIAAGMYAYSGILTALFRRERTGGGAALEISMLEALGEWMGFPSYFAGYGEKEPPRIQSRIARNSGGFQAMITPTSSPLIPTEFPTFPYVLCFIFPLWEIIDYKRLRCMNGYIHSGFEVRITM
jgi:crotonobetainyl-CoA:carnitine CoA-transferase CaiB-like acyl-CoA transferase